MSATLIRGKASPGTVEKRLTFRYGKALVVGRFVLFASLTGLASVFVVLFTSGQLEAVLGLAALLVSYFVLFTLSPILTQHWITMSRLILRQGWYFRAVIPFSDIDDLRAAGDTGPLRTPLGLSRPLGQPVLFVTGGRTNLVTLRLLRPRRFWQFFGLSASEIVFDVTDRDRFLAAIEERRRLFSPVQADRAHANLGD